jgi:hypothetical protein
MENQRLTAWKPSNICALSRRDIVRGLAGAGLGFGALRLPDTIEAKNTKKKKGKKRKNEKQDKKQKQKQDRNQNPPVDTPPVVDSPPPLPPPPPPPLRQVVTQTFSNPNPILIPGTDPMGSANPYPATIVVSGMTNGVIFDVNVVLSGFNHKAPADVDVLLAATHLPGRNAIIMSDVGSDFDVVVVDLTLDDAAAVGMPNAAPLAPGAFKPTNVGISDPFVAPAPAPTGNSALSTFNGQNPNGTWELFVMDDASPDAGALFGWTLQITAEVDA